MRVAVPDVAPGIDPAAGREKRLTAAKHRPSRCQHHLHEAAGASPRLRRRRFRLETKSGASYVVEAAVFELRMADLGASGEVRAALIDRAADAILAEATDWEADLIVLGTPRRGEFMTRLFGSVTLRVLQRAPCPVLVASATGRGGRHRAGQEQHAGHRS